MSESTSVSSSVSSGKSRAGATGRGRERKLMTRWAMVGPKITSPLATARTAGSTSAWLAPFSTYPRAPARMAEKTRSSSSYIVTIKTPIWRLVWTMVRVASIPFAPGIWISIRMTSGCNAAAREIASMRIFLAVIKASRRSVGGQNRQSPPFHRLEVTRYSSYHPALRLVRASTATRRRRGNRWGHRARHPQSAGVEDGARRPATRRDSRCGPPRDAPHWSEPPPRSGTPPPRRQQAVEAATEEHPPSYQSLLRVLDRHRLQNASNILGPVHRLLEEIVDILPADDLNG